MFLESGFQPSKSCFFKRKDYKNQLSWEMKIGFLRNIQRIFQIHKCYLKYTSLDTKIEAESVIFYQKVS